MRAMAHIGPRSLDSHYPPKGGLVLYNFKIVIFQLLWVRKFDRKIISPVNVDKNIIYKLIYKYITYQVADIEVVYCWEFGRVDSFG